MSKEEKAPVKYYEAVERKSSGFVMDGTKGTAYQQELNVPAIRWIPTKGRAVNPDVKGGFREIQYVQGCDSIDPKVQREQGVISRPFEDKIGMENGFMTVERSGNTINLYDYLEQVFYNMDNPNRSPGATAIFREVKLDKKAVVLMDEDEQITNAKSIVYTLRVNTGDKKAPYKYNEDKIDALCRLVGVWDETPERKLILLLDRASRAPKEFIEIVTRSEQTIITELSHALELGVIQFDKNVSQFVSDKEMIYEVDAGSKATQDEKITKLAAFLGTNPGTPALTKIRAKLEIAREKNL